MIAYGEENRDWGGAFECLPRPDQSCLPYHRLFGSRPFPRGDLSARRWAMPCPVAALWRADVLRFYGPGGDEIFNQMARVAVYVG